MVSLVSDGLSCGVAHTAEVRAPYASLEEAQRQADHGRLVGRTPLRIEEAETGEVLWEA